MPATLGQFATGTRLRVVGYRADTVYTEHLMRLGIVPGTQIELVRRAPLGDPVEIRLRGYSLALRPAEADALELEKIDS